MLSTGNLARIAKVIALLLFVLPWVTISCSPRAISQMGGADAVAMAAAPDVPLATATGLQLATGGVAVSEQARSGPVASSNPFGKPNAAVLAAAVLILLSLAATFVLKGSTGPLAAAAGSALAAAALCYTILVQIPQAARGAFSGAGGGAPTGGPSPEQMAQMIQVHVEIGFWLVLAALAAAVVLNVLAMRGAPPVAAAAAPPAAPPADPPPSV